MTGIATHPPLPPVPSGPTRGPRDLGHGRAWTGGRLGVGLLTTVAVLSAGALAMHRPSSLGSAPASELMAVESVTPQAVTDPAGAVSPPIQAAEAAPVVMPAADRADVPAAPGVADEPPQAAPAPAAPPRAVSKRLAAPTFDGRPIRPGRTIRMVVTGYSPDARSCGASADGITASGYSVWTNGMKMVAADARVLPFGALVAIPGYHGDKPVPVLDRGGAIKGNRLDLLFPTHEQARAWGRRTLTVTMWEYAD